MKTRSLKNLVPSALFLAIGLVLPFFTGQIPTIGKMLLPMHIPVLLCGLICGWQWGLGVRPAPAALAAVQHARYVSHGRVHGL